MGLILKAGESTSRDKGGKGIPSGGNSNAKTARESKAFYLPETQGWAFLPLRAPQVGEESPGAGSEH